MSDRRAGASQISVTFHGVRGSTPCHGPEIVRYGGNTSCVSLDVPGHDPILFDLGTGLRYFGLERAAGEPFRGTCLLSHLHWDHIQGLPFFAPLLRNSSEVLVYAPQQESGRTVRDVFVETVAPPLFPVDLDALPGSVRFRDITDDEFRIGDVEVIARLIPHVGNTCGYRVTWRGISVAYLSDHQMPLDGSHAVTDGALELCRDVDLLIHDAQFTPAEFAEKPDWGHCTIEYAIWLAAEAGARTLALFHHDPTHHDDEMDRIAVAAMACGDRNGLEVFAAAEGTTVQLVPRPTAD